MGSLTIPDLDDQVFAWLRVQARLRGTSVEDEARRILAAGADPAIRIGPRPSRGRASDAVRENRER